MADKIRSDAEAMIEQEAGRHRDEMRREVVGLAMQLAEDILEAQVSDDDRARLNDEYVKNLQEMAQ